LHDVDRVVSSDRLADIVFDGVRSDASLTTLRSYVARLRRALVDDGSGVRIVTVPPGYRLELGRASLDSVTFESGIVRARTQIQRGDLLDAADTLADALGLWRGPAFAEFADQEWARTEARRLEELRVDALELLFRTMVDAGEHEAAIGPLTKFVDEHPLRSAGWVALTVALYRADRQAESLRVAGRHRQAMAELGLTPSPDVADVERRVAVNDAELFRPDPPPRRLRGYELGGVLGEGRHGVVHRAIQPGVDREVALRMLGPEIADLGDFIREFEPLIQRVAGLEHAHVAPILDYWREAGLACIVTRLFRGGDLADRIEKGPAATEAVATLVDQVGSALQAGHRSGLAHGALTAKEILFDDDGNAYVDAIAVSSALDELAGQGHRSNRTRPTFEDGRAADQRALARLVFGALAGEPPPLDAADGGFPLISQVRPELLALDGVLARAGAAAPEDRYADVAAFVRSFTAAVGRGPSLVQPAAPNPYRGLRAFGEADAQFFVGRDHLVDQLVDHLSAMGERQGAFLTIVGPSGSGKSSVVHAGLLPRLRRGAVPGSERWFVAKMVPGHDPYATLAEALNDVATGPLPTNPERSGIVPSLARSLPLDGRLLLFIDQLEELFIQTPADVGDRFVEELSNAVDEFGARLHVVATLRADCYDLPLGHHRFGAIVAGGAVSIVAMSPAELERAIVAPASSVGVGVDGQVVAEIVSACATRAGSLPLLQFTMTELFERRSGTTITNADYVRIGGIAGAVAERAEHVFGQLTSTQRSLTRSLFVRLVAVGVGSDDIRRRIERPELLGLADDGREIDVVLERFGAARLLTFDRDPATRVETVEVAHEALLRAWPRLRDWAREEGDDLALREELRSTATTWDHRGRDDSELARGARLAMLEDFTDRRRTEVNSVERAYVERAVSARDEALMLERAGADHQRRLNRRLVVALVAVVAVLAAAVTLGWVAAGQRNRARDEAAAAERARGRSLAVAAIGEASTDRSLALLLALEAGDLDGSLATRRALWTALTGGAPFTRTVIPTPADDYSAMVVATDGSVAVAKRGDGAVDVIDLVQRTVRFADLPSPSRVDQGLALSPDGGLAVSAGVAGGGVAAVVIDVADGSRVTEIGGEDGAFHEARFSLDGALLAIASPDGHVRLFDVNTWALVETLELGEARTITALEFVPGNRLLVAATPLDGLQPLADATLTMFDTASGETVGGPIEVGGGLATVMAIEPEVGVVISAVDAHLQIRDLDELSLVAEPFGDSAFGGYSAFALSPQGLLVAVSPLDFDVFALDDDGAQPIPAESAATYAGVAFVDEGRVLVGADIEGSIAAITPGWVDDLGEPLEPAGPGALTLSPDGRTLAVWGLSRGVQLFDGETHDHLGELPVDGPSLSFVGIAFDPTGRKLATLTCPTGDHPPDGSCPAALTVWDIANRQNLAGPVEIGEVWAWMTDGVAFVDAGRSIATAGYEGDVTIRDAGSLDVSGPRLTLRDVAPFPGDQTRAIAAAEADGRSLLIATGELSEGVVWDVTDGRRRPVGVVAGNVSDVGADAGGMPIAAQGTGTFTLLDPETLEPAGEPFVSELATQHFHSSDAATIVTSGIEGAQVWDVATRQPITGLLAAAFAQISPDGTEVYLGALGTPGPPLGTTVRVLSLDDEALRDEACERAGRNLTAKEWTLYMPADTPYRLTCPKWPKPLT
jgi:DNA-binding SARP family transcriptional activator/WD40 repeat protein